jgi:alpha-L-fucosidase 2
VTREYLREAWPVLRGAAEFCLHWLVELPDGSLGTNPSTSRRTTRTEDPLVEQMAAARKRIPDPWIGGRGQLQEWAADLPEAEPHHRHVSSRLVVGRRGERRTDG